MLSCRNRCRLSTVVLASELEAQFAAASSALGRLDGIAAILPETSLFLYSYVRKEAVLSSQIEGTQSSLSDLLLFENDEAPGVPLDDVQEVSNYVAALEHGMRRLREGFPISLRLIRELNEILFSKGRGSQSPACRISDKPELDWRNSYKATPGSSRHLQRKSWRVWTGWKNSFTRKPPLC